MTMLPTAAFDGELERLIDRLHDGERLRVWSIVITIFGDAVLPRGGVLALGALQQILQRLRIEAGAVRAATSRLAADGWLNRERRGRNSFYALTASGRHQFDLATRRIYAATPVAWSGDWTLCVVPEEAGGERSARRRLLRDLGFGTLGPTTFLRPETAAAPDATEALAGATVFRAEAQAAAGLPGLTASAWPLRQDAEDYAAFEAAFGPLLRGLPAGVIPDPLDALAARTLLIHEFRRIALRDPLLPAGLLPADWPGESARQLARRVYYRLVGPSEAWLDACRGAPDGPLPPPPPAFARRFGGQPLDD